MVRIKKRYLVVKITGRMSKVTGTMIYFSVLSGLQNLHGDFGVAACKPGLEVKYLIGFEKIAVIGIRHGPHQLVCSTIPTIKSIGGNRVNLQTIYMGGTLRNCYRFLRRHIRLLAEQNLKGLRNTPMFYQVYKTYFQSIPNK